MKLSRNMKKMVKAEQAKVLEEMSKEGITAKDWDTANKKYQTYTEMLKTSWKFTPDTLLVVGGNLLGIALILNFEKLDIVRSKALGFVLKGKI